LSSGSEIGCFEPGKSFFEDCLSGFDFASAK
jgi:hypothetical protein